MHAAWSELYDLAQARATVGLAAVLLDVQRHHTL